MMGYTKKLLSMMFCDTTAVIGASFKTHGMMVEMADGQTYVYIEIVT